MPTGRGGLRVPPPARLTSHTLAAAAATCPSQSLLIRLSTRTSVGLGTAPFARAPHAVAVALVGGSALSKPLYMLGTGRPAPPAGPGSFPSGFESLSGAIGELACSCSVGV